MSSESLLETAKQKLIDTEYKVVQEMLVPQIFAYRTSSEFYALLGIATLKLGDFESAYSYLKRSEDLDPRRLDTRLALAVVYLKQQKTNLSLQIWLSIAEKDPDNIYAQRGLNLLRDAPENIDWSKVSEREVLSGLLPYQEKPVIRQVLQDAQKTNKKNRILGIGAFVLSIIILLGFFIFGPKNQGQLVQPSLSPKGVEKVRFVLSEQEIANAVKKIDSAFSNYDDNTFIIQSNIILNSNASETTKSQVRELAKNIKNPDLLTFKNTIDFASVQKDPEVHNGVFVKWKATIADTNVENNALVALLLVDYDPEHSLSGKVRGFVPSGQRVEKGDSIELLAKVVTETSEEQKFLLQILSFKLVAKN